MKIQLLSFLTSAALSVVFSSSSYAEKDPSEMSQGLSSDKCASFLNHSIKKLHSKKTIDLCALTAGKPVLIVNTASNCGYTPQFKQLEALHKKYKDKGLVVIGFPSNDFFQEEDDEKNTAKVCFINYGVTFTMLTKNAVRGSDAQPVFKYLANKTTAPKWNFNKYIISADGESIEHFNSSVAPNSPEFITAIVDLL